MNSILTEGDLTYVIIIVIAIVIGGLFFVMKLKAEKDRKLELIIGISAGVSIILVMYSMIISTHSNIRIEEN